VSDQVKPSFVIFDIRALLRSWLSVRVPGCQKYKWRLNSLWQATLYSCTIWQQWVSEGYNSSRCCSSSWVALGHHKRSPVSSWMCSSAACLPISFTHCMSLMYMYTVFRKKHPLTFSFISPWVMC